MKIIPAIDIIKGKCVRLLGGDYGLKTIYSNSPVDVAKSFQDAGLKYLHLVDLDGAKKGDIVNLRVLEEIASSTSLEIDFSGGIKNKESFQMAINAGANKITIGSMAVNNTELFFDLLAEFGAHKIILGADSKNEKIAVKGWTESSDLETIEFIKSFSDKGVKTIMCTSIDKDGAMAGPDFELYEKILSQTKIELIASGGVSSMKDLVMLKEIGCHGAIIGKAIYENQIGLQELSTLC